jgi:hypothetical protein
MKFHSQSWSWKEPHIIYLKCCRHENSEQNFRKVSSFISFIVAEPIKSQNFVYVFTAHNREDNMILQAARCDKDFHFCKEDFVGRSGQSVTMK